MKKTISLLVISLTVAALLSGCGSLYSNYREIEQLCVMQTLGLDRVPGGIAVTLSAAADKSGSTPLCFSGTGESVSAAIESARLHAVEEDLFTGHLKHILVGEAAARQGIDSFLSYICRSPDARLDMPLFILQGADAREVLTAVGNGEKGASEVLQAAHTKLNSQLGGHVFTAAEVLRSCARNGSALICALPYTNAAELSGGDAAAGAQQATAYKSAAAEGAYAVIKDGKLCEFIGRETSLGVSFLTNTVGIRSLVIRDRFGSPVTLEINRGGTRLYPLWNPDGTLRGLEIYATVSASLLEAGSHALSSVESADYLTGQLEAAISEQLGAVLWLSRQLEADFLGLGDRIEQASPLEYRRLGQPLGPLLPSLELSIAVQGELSHSHDME